jgi:hypothetical protein
MPVACQDTPDTNEALGFKKMLRTESGIALVQYQLCKECTVFDFIMSFAVELCSCMY